MKKKYIIGVDPGNNGGVAIIDTMGNIIKTMKITPDKENGGIHVKDILMFINENLHGNEKDWLQIVIEDVHAIFGTSAKSNFIFGRNLGELLGFVKLIEIDYSRITPQKWQKIVWNDSDIVKKEKGKDTKKTTLNAVKRIYPKDVDKLLATKRSKVPHDGIVDAVAIAYSFLLENRSKKGFF